VDSKDKVPIKNASHATFDVELEAKILIPEQLHDAKLDFHDFDNNRIEVSLVDNQVKATYNDDTGMPRYYALVHDAISSKQLNAPVGLVLKVSKSWAPFVGLDLALPRLNSSKFVLEDCFKRDKLLRFSH